MSSNNPSWLPKFFSDQMEDLTKKTYQGKIFQVVDDDQFICMGCQRPLSGERKKVQVMDVEKKDEKESNWKLEGYVCSEECFNFFLMKVS